MDLEESNRDAHNSAHAEISRLSRISTIWSMLDNAHGNETFAADHAKQSLIERYEGAVLRYLTGATKDSEQAEQLFQEFALRLISGHYRNAKEEKGRFRDYLRRSLINLVTDHFRQQKKAREYRTIEGVAEIVGDLKSIELFDACWKKELLKKTWLELKDFEATTQTPYHTALTLRVAMADLNSEQLAQEFIRKTGTAMTPGGFRKLVERARKKFAELLIEEVSRTLESDDIDRIEEEIIDLDLLQYCKESISAFKANKS